MAKRLSSLEKARRWGLGIFPNFPSHLRAVKHLIIVVFLGLIPILFSAFLYYLYEVEKSFVEYFSDGQFYLYTTVFCAMALYTIIKNWDTRNEWPRFTDTITFLAILALVLSSLIYGAVFATSEIFPTLLLESVISTVDAQKFLDAFNISDERIVWSSLLFFVISMIVTYYASLINEPSVANVSGEFHDDIDDLERKFKKKLR